MLLETLSAWVYCTEIIYLNSKRDYLAFECAMKEEGQVRLHTGGYSVCRFSIGTLLHCIAMKVVN